MPSPSPLCFPSLSLPRVPVSFNTLKRFLSHHSNTNNCGSKPLAPLFLGLTRGEAPSPSVVEVSSEVLEVVVGTGGAFDDKKSEINEDDRGVGGRLFLERR
ncbi:hypothetical protein TRVL_04470 [Trypanosoma vivax]|nr:hypothetical protein TRVL_04470 [Trypanosoma vivax]